MLRKTFDALATLVGVGLVVLLLAAGGLLMWGYSTVNGQVHDQLASQQIYFPTKTNPEFKALPSANQAAMGQYAGQLMTNGAQAKTYADSFIAYHLSQLPDKGVYSKLSAASRANPKNATLASAEATSFQGTTLRSMLLSAYGWWQVGQIVLISAIVTFAGAFVMAVLAVLGAVHLRRTSPETQVFARLGRTPAKAKAETSVKAS